MEQLLAIPSDVLSCVFLPYLTIQEVGCVDTAVSSQLRPALYESYSMSTFTHSVFGIDSNQMQWFFNRAIRLEKIILSHNLSPTDISKIVDMLSKLCLNRVKLFDARYNLIWHEDIQKFTGCCSSSLHSLSFHHSSISCADINLVAKGCIGLTHLDLSFCTHVTTCGIIALFQQCPQLSHLNLSECQLKDDFICCMTDPKLKVCWTEMSLATLILAGNSLLTDVSIVSISLFFTLLTTLQLHSSNLVTDTSVIAVAQNCSRINTLHLSSCGIRNRAVLTLAETCSSLTSLHLWHCTFISDSSIINLVQGCPLLTLLHLGSCYLISDQAIISLANFGARLRHLNLSCCPNISDLAVMALARGKYSPKLTVLNVRFCHNISDEALNTLLSCCPSLTSLVKPGGRYL